jgi:hypothetical protein
LPLIFLIETVGANKGAVRMKKVLSIVTAGMVSAVTFSLLATAQDAQQPMSFFVTSVGLGDGANLGGLSGADKHCQTLVGQRPGGSTGGEGKTWRAYLSAQALEGRPGVNARDRIGQGPWYNVRGALIAENLGHLHGDTLEQARLGNRLHFRSALTEQGNEVNGHNDGPDLQQPGDPNRHDILTGSRSDGRAYAEGEDRTCENWTSNGDGSAQVGHHNRTAWNSAHPSRGCSQENLARSGGGGLFYCFAVD